MTREEIVSGMAKMADFFKARADMAVGDGKILLLNWMRCAEEAAEVVRAQEPVVMTLEEVKMLDRDYYYLEAMRSPGKELREIVGAYGLTCVTWPSITWARQTMGDGGYGKTWRCWTSRPTDEQREAIPWE